MKGRRFQRGRAVRRTVLGAEHVDPQLRAAQGHELLEPLQAVVTEFAWGDVWGRPGMTLKQRSLLTVALLSALNRGQELEAHMRGAKRNGATLAEIREVLLHTCVYAGFPAGFDGMRAALKVYGSGSPTPSGQDPPHDAPGAPLAEA